MATVAYCWRCKTEVPMLDEQEWEQIYPDLHEEVRQIKECRFLHDTPLIEAKTQVYGDVVVRRYYELTGFHAKTASAVWHHRLSRFGCPCTSCGKLLRTPKAKVCAECGARVES